MNFLDPSIYTSRARPSGGTATAVSLPIMNPKLLEQDPPRDYTVFNFFDEGMAKNSLLNSLVTRRCDAVRRAPIVLYDQAKPDVAIPYSDKIPLYKLLYHPNDDLRLPDMLAILEECRILGGEGYLYTKRVKGVIDQIIPYSTAFFNAVPNSDNGIDHYLFDNGQNNKVEITKANIMRFVWTGYDPKKPWKTPSPMAACGLELDCDYLRASLTYNLLKYGISPSYVITLGEGHDIDPNNVSRLSEQIQLRFSGKNQSRAAILHSGDKIEKLQNDIAQFNGAMLSELPETRLADELRIPIQMTSLKAAATNKTYTNYKEAAYYFFKEIEKTWEDYGQVLTSFFENEVFIGDKKKYIIKFDVSNIEELHDSIDMVQDRAIAKFEGNTITLDECRIMQGLLPFPDKTLGSQLLTQIEAGPTQPTVSSSADDGN